MVDYKLALNIINVIVIVAYGLMLLFSWYYIVSFVAAARKVPPVPHCDKKTKFAVIVPARNESKVIRNLLYSMTKQTYDKKYFDVWVIVEDENDLTVKYVKDYGYNVFIRKDLDNKHTKGFAIQELYNYLETNNIIYDAYLIFDADNVAGDNYLEIMNDLRQSGVQVGQGYRNYTNASKNWLTCTSATFFAYMMTFTSRMRTYLFKKATICGTGFFIDRQILVDAGGWIFTGLTEDAELTKYCYYHDVNMRYYPLVDFYDEQCDNLKDSHNQKIRWVFGYFSRSKLMSQGDVNYHTISKRRMFWAKFEYNLGIYPFAAYGVLSLLAFIIAMILSIHSIFFNQHLTGSLFAWSIFSLGILYGTFILIALAVIIKDNKHLKFNMPTIVWTTLTYALFYFDIILGIIDGIFNKKKRKMWNPISHKGDITISDLKDK